MRTIKKQMKSLLSKAHVCSGCNDQPTKNKINRLHKKVARDYAGVFFKCGKPLLEKLLNF